MDCVKLNCSLWNSFDLLGYLKVLDFNPRFFSVFYETALRSFGVL